MKIVRVLLIGPAEAAQLLPSANAEKGKQFQITRKAKLSEGLDTLKESIFDVVLLSLSLPDSSATEATTRTLKVARDLPVIALADEGEKTKAIEASSLGAYGYFLKGCQCDSLSQMICHAMARTQLIAKRENTLQRSPENEEQLTAHLAHNSHQLRNALACIRQFGNILIDGLAGKLSDEQREYVTIMLENASTIRGVVDSTLDEMSESLEDPHNISNLSKVDN
jgi:DNA-binding NtrC family response regulator